jgi:hypothetical protein
MTPTEYGREKATKKLHEGSSLPLPAGSGISPIQEPDL